MKFGTEIQNRRKQLGLSVRETARRAKMSHAYLSQLERGNVENPSRGIVRALQLTLGLNEFAGMKVQSTFVIEMQDGGFASFDDFQQGLYRPVYSIEDLTDVTYFNNRHEAEVQLEDVRSYENKGLSIVDGDGGSTHHYPCVTDVKGVREIEIRLL